VSAPRESALAVWALRLLLDDGAPPPPPPPSELVPWGALATLAERNGVLIRLAQRFERLGIKPAAVFYGAVAREAERVAATIELIRQVGEACARHDIDFIFPKALQHYPDMGADVDLLVLSRSADVDRVILQHLPAEARGRDLRSRMAHATVYRVAGCPSLLDIHHGRLGVLGEYTALPALLVKNRQPARVDGLHGFVPSLEDQILLQGLERVSGRRSLRLADVAFTVHALRLALDWDYILGTTRELGGLHPLSCYLSYVDQAYERCFGSGLLPPELRRELILDGWGRVEFGSGRLQFPALRANARIYLHELDTMIAARNWASAGRLLLLPLVAATAGWARVEARLP